MKLLLFFFVYVAATAADVSHLPSNGYLPPVPEATVVTIPSNEYLTPVQQVVLGAAPVYASAPAHVLADDGYRYKTHRRVVYRRNRRDVSHLPASVYLPPVQEASAAVPSNEYLPPVQQAAAAPATSYAPVSVAVEASPAHILADDGYRYKTHRRVVYRRNRRDVSHLPSSEYLPPVQKASLVTPSIEYLPPVQQAAPAPATSYAPVPVAVEASPAHILADDGYRYKTRRRVVYRRNRRDVSHLPASEYLPPVQEASAVVPSNEYLPPVQQAAPAPATSYAPVPVAVEASPAHILADDGYRYKTHRRVVYRRNRRDVSHLPSSEYLPPVQKVLVAPSNEYLPPAQQAAPSLAPLYTSASAAVKAAPAHFLSDDGYRYKAHRRIVYRQIRFTLYIIAFVTADVSHLSNQYLPPNHAAASTPSASYSFAASAPGPSYSVPPQNNNIAAFSSAFAVEPEYAASEPAPFHSFSSLDGYRYKTQRRVVYRHRQRRGAPSSEYLPPAASSPSVEYLPPAASVPASSYSTAPSYESYAPAASYQTESYAEPSYGESAPGHSFSPNGGYRYKTARRRVYRRRRY